MPEHSPALGAVEPGATSSLGIGGKPGVVANYSHAQRTGNRSES